MKFHEKLVKLRKEKGLSQEDLAYQLHTSRQAVSKWESGQGYPDTEKLLMLGNVFEVSMDYLLKDQDEQPSGAMNGYYVSKEVAYEFLFSEKKLNLLIAIGSCLLFMSGIPYTLIQDNQDLKIIVMAIFIAFGVAFFIGASLKEVGKFKILKREPLLFDNTFLKELNIEYHHLSRKYMVLAFIGAFLIFVGATPIVIIVREFMSIKEFSSWHSMCFLMIGIGFLCFIVAVSSIETYQMLVKNNEYTNRFSVKLMNRIHRFIEKL